MISIEWKQWYSNFLYRIQFYDSQKGQTAGPPNEPLCALRCKIALVTLKPEQQQVTFNGVLSLTVLRVKYFAVRNWHVALSQPHWLMIARREELFQNFHSLPSLQSLSSWSIILQLSKSQLSQWQIIKQYQPMFCHLHFDILVSIPSWYIKTF